MGKSKRKFSKFLVAALAASFLVQPGTTVYASGITPTDAIQFEVSDVSEEKKELEQEKSNEQQETLEEESSELSTADETKSEEESSVAEEITKEEESSAAEETTSEEASITEESTKDTPKEEESSKVEENSEKEASKTEETPEEKETSIIEEAPSEKETSKIEGTPKEEETSIIEENLIAEIASEDILQKTQESEEREEVWFNTGTRRYLVVNNKEDVESEYADYCFEEDGSYTIQIPEENPFFPYEVEFRYQGETTKEWFLTPSDSVKIGEHTFYVSAKFDGTTITQMSFNIAGDIVIAYPKKKYFLNSGRIEERSLLPLEELSLQVDFSSYTPAELAMVSVHSIFFGEKELTNTDKVVWTYNRKDDFTVTSLGDVMDLSYRTSDYNNATYQMIIKTADQLDKDNVRCIVNMTLTNSREWLTPMVYIQDNTGRVGSYVLESFYRDWNNRDKREFEIDISSKEWKDDKEAYIKLDINKDIFSEPHYKYFKVYNGKYKSVSEAMAGTDITDKICSTDMTQKDAGYLITRDQDNWITIVTFDEKDNATGCLPIIVSLDSLENGISYELLEKTKDGYVDIVSSRTYSFKNECEYVTYTLKPGYAINGTYYQKLFYWKNGILDSSNSFVTAAYIGQYSSISAAKAANAKEIKIHLFGEEGYAADYSQGIYFTIFVGEDGEEKQEIYQYCFKTEEFKEHLSNSTEVYFYGVEGISSYRVPDSEDSYSEFNYLTILVDEDVDLANLAPTFQTYGGTLYAKGSSTPEISGESYHDFSKGAVQYTVSAENGTDSKNYWLRILKPSSGAGQLYVNSMEDSNSGTKTENNIIYSNREVYLDGYHNYEHDIVLINVGTEAISSISVEIESNVVELNDYWTLKGKNSLLGFGSVEERFETAYGELNNLAKIRIQAKDGIKDGAEVSGKLIIKSNDTTLMVLTLSGIVGDPCIITEEIPPAVLYVPYGAMIQNNNKYSWNQVRYSIEEGSLPEGMELKRNGELYGVPMETGEFPITLKATNSSSRFGSSSAKLVLVVNDNTNVNVYTASDTGYIIEEHIGVEVGTGTYDYVLRRFSDQLFVSSGEYVEFIDLWLNGEKLVDGVDYTKDSGSTRITIRSQTFEKKAEKSGRNTIAAEFRVGGDESKELKRTAQNFRLDLKNSSSSSGSSGSSGGSSSSGSSSSSSSGSSGSSGNSSSNASSNNSTTQNNSTNNNPASTGYSDDSWIKDETGWWCKNPDGSWLADTWFQLPYKGTTGWYYFNDQGYMITGWLSKNGQWYYLNPVSDGTQGMMCTGWKLINGQWCYFDKEGSLVMNTWCEIPYMETTKWYYLNEQGYMASGWLSRNNKWYYLSPESDKTQGMMCTGWQLVGGKWYYLNPDGDLATDTWIGDYYVNSDGVWVE